jgi:hypothetical protein
VHINRIKCCLIMPSVSKYFQTLRLHFLTFHTVCLSSSSNFNRLSIVGVFWSSSPCNFLSFPLHYSPLFQVFPSPFSH